MSDVERFADFSGYGVQIRTSDREPMMLLDVVSEHVFIHAKTGWGTVRGNRLETFLAVIRVKKHALEARFRRCTSSDPPSSHFRSSAYVNRHAARMTTLFTSAGERYLDQQIAISTACARSARDRRSTRRPSPRRASS